MNDFLRTVSRMGTERHNAILGRLAARKIPCGLFVGADTTEEIVNTVKTVLNLGLNVPMVYTWSGSGHIDTGSGQIAVEPLNAFAGNPRRLGHVLLSVHEYHSALWKLFARWGVPSVQFISNPYYNEAVYAELMAHLPSVYESYAALGDGLSREVFLRTLLGMVSSRPADWLFAEEPQYALPGFTPKAGDIAVDGGAFDGQTALDMASLGATVYSFEMDAANYQRCAETAREHGFTAENLGLADKAGEERYVVSRTASHRDGDGNAVARFVNLDSYVEQRQLPRIDYIKLDIEGSELAALRGAAATIRRCKPAMAVSAYHKPDDMWTLIPYLRALRPDYEFAFRHYAIDAGYCQANGMKHLPNMRQLGLIGDTVPTSWERVIYCR